MTEKIRIPKSFLLSGRDLIITDSIKVKHPTLQEVLDIDDSQNGFYSEDIYYSWVSLFLCDPYDYMVYLDDKKIDYENVDSFDLFIMLYEDMVKKYDEQNRYLIGENKNKYKEDFSLNPYFKAFKFFLGIDSFILAKNANGEMVIGDEKKQRIIIDRTIFSYISEFIRLINGISNTDKINPEDEFAKQILIEDERAKRKKMLKRKNKDFEPTDRLGNLISAITWGSNGSINPFNRNDLHMFDLVDGILRTDKVFNFNHTMTGVYSGCVNQDKININKISWQS